MDTVTVSKQQVSACQKNKKFVSRSYTSKEEFIREYRKLNYEKAQTAELFLLIFTELEKSVSEGNIDNFKKLRCLIKYASQMTDEFNLKDYYNNLNNPIRNANLAILACKQNKEEILKYLFDDDSKILNNLCMSIERNSILPDYKDDTCHNAFYYAICSSNVELLNTLITMWPGNYFKFHLDELDVILSRAYEELKLKNVPLSDKMKIFVEDKLINLRFFSNTSIRNKNYRCDLNTIKKRMELVLGNINLLKTEYSTAEEVDEKFLFVTKFIAQNIHVLKQQLKSTYDRLPWEEMEFFLVSFVSAYTKQQEINLYYYTILNKKKILNQLENFGKKLEEERINIEAMDSTKLSDLPKLTRHTVVANIIDNCPQFEELYNDYQQIRDIYSLQTINEYINVALSTNPSEKEGQLIILRVLQVIGEYLKNTLESPKLSDTTSELFLLSLPKHTREVIKDLRNSLSHAFSLNKRIEIEKNADANFFINVQNDIKKVGSVVTDVLYSNKMQIIKIILGRIISCKHVHELGEIMKAVNSLKFNTMCSETFKLYEFEKLEKFVEELNSILTDKTDSEKELIDQINNIISSVKIKSQSTETDYVEKFVLLSILCTTCNDTITSHNVLRAMKHFASKILESIAPEIKHRSIKEIATLSVQIHESVTSRKPNSDLDKINTFIRQIWYIAKFEANNIKSIKKLSEKLSYKNPFTPIKKPKKIYNIIEEEYKHQLALKLSELKTMLDKCEFSDQIIEKYFSCTENKKLLTAIKMLVLDIMSILGSFDNCLEDNLFSLDDSTPLLTGKCLRNHLAHGNALVDILLFEPSLTVILNARKLTTENIIKNSKKIGKFVKDDPFKLEDKFNKSLPIITNQKRMFDTLKEGNLEDLKDCLKKGADLNARDFKLWTAMHFAATGPSLDVIKFLLDHNINANVKNIDGQNPLHIAAAYDRSNIVQYFLQNTDLYIDNRDNNGRTPLHIATQRGNKDTVNVLLKNNADPNIKNIVGYSTLPTAVESGHLDVVKILLEKEVHVDDNEILGDFTLLHLAAEHGYLDIVNFLLENGANVNARNDGGVPPSHAAALNGHLEIVNALLLNGADPNIRAVNGFTALHCAVENGHEAVANILLKYGANANVSEKAYNWTPLHYAARNGNYGIVKILLKNKANINILTVEGASALHYAVQSGHLEIVITLLEHGANVNAKDTNKMTSLHYAAEVGHKEIVDFLLKNGAEVNLNNSMGITPLYTAIMRSHTDIVDLLIKYEADINGRDIKGNTPLHAAVTLNNKDIIDLLIKRKADVNAKNDRSITPMHVAAANGYIDIIDLLIKNKAEIHIRSNDNFTPLHVAAASGRVDATTFLIKNGADVNQTNKFGITVLHSTVIVGHKDIVNILIKNKADVNIIGPDGSTALHAAAGKGSSELVEILIRNGANVNNENKNNHTPLFEAVKSNSKEVVKLLIANGANVNAANGIALLCAINSGNKDIVKILLDSKADIHSKLFDGTYTPLHIAATKGETEIVDALIAKGADINATNDDGSTPLHCAVIRGYKETVELLLLKGANVNANSIDGPPLHYAASTDGCTDIVKILLNNGADVSIKDPKNRRALELAVANNHLEYVKLLLSKSKKMDINAKGNDNWTVLHIAAQCGSLEMIKYLIQEGSDINAKNSSSSKAIHIAARDGFKDIVEFFLSKGCTIHDRGICNQTLLHYAAMKGQLEIVNYLISKGADIDAQDDKGLSPMHIAAAHGHESVIDVLLQNGAIYNIVDTCNIPPILMTKETKITMKLIATEKLFGAVKSNNISEVENCIKKGAGINAKHAAAKGHNGTALHYASWRGYEKIVNVLLQNKANPNITGDKDFTPLHYAAKFSHFEIVMILLSNGAIYNAVSDVGKTPLDFAADERIVNLLKLVTQSFKNVENNRAKVVNDLNQIKDINTMKAIMNARNEENQCLIVVAMINNFSKVEQLKQLLQGDVSSQIDKATVLMIQEYFQQSMNIFQRVLEKRKEIYGPDNPATLDIQTYIAKIIYKQGAYQEAANMTDEIFRKQKEMLGLDNEYTLSTRSMYALILHRQGENDEALSIFEEVYKKQKKILRSDHRNISDTQVHMALVLCALKQYDRALELNKIVFENRKRSLGENHPDTVRVQNNIAMVLSLQHKYEEALEMYQVVFEKKQTVLGVCHSDTIRTLAHIGEMYRCMRRYKEALNIMQEVLDLQKKILGEDHPDTLYSQHNLAEMYIDQGKIFSALKIYNEYFDKIKAVFGPGHEIVESITHKIECLKLRHKIGGVSLSQMSGFLQRDINTAASNGNAAVVRKMLEDGVDINDQDFEGRAPLHFAVSNRHVDIVNLLLENGADVTQVTKKGNTPLHIAASKNYTEIVEILLRRTSRQQLMKFLNAQTTGSGATSLHIAAKNGFLDTVKCLLAHGAIYNVRNKNGETPSELSTDINVKLLLDLIDSLFRDTRNGVVHVIKSLEILSRENFLAVVNARDTSESTLLQVAVSNKHKNIASKLLEMIQREI